MAGPVSDCWPGDGFEQPENNAEMVDSDEKIDAFLPLIDEVIQEGMATIERVRIHLYRAGNGED